MNIAPMEQFEIRTLIPLHFRGFDLSITNAALSMIVATLLLIGLMTLWTRKMKMVPHAGQSVIEMTYSFIAKMVDDTIGQAGRGIIPFVFTLFVFLLFGNMLGLFPYIFTFTSHLSVVGTMALIGLFLSVILGVYHQGFSWLHVFMPKGIPWVLAPIIVPIEVMSFLSRPFSLTIRLVMNMVVGHVMIDVIAAFVIVLGLAGFIPLLFAGVLIIFEAGIALLQAYIYTILTCIYLSESFKTSH